MTDEERQSLLGKMKGLQESIAQIKVETEARFKTIAEDSYAAGRKAMAEEQSSKSCVVCPFCGEGGFDHEGLKNHFKRRWCDVYINCDRAEALSDHLGDANKKVKA